MTAFIRRHPATSYFTLVFLLSWAGVLAVIWPGPIPAPPDEAERRFPFVYLSMLIGPPVAPRTEAGGGAKPSTPPPSGPPARATAPTTPQYPFQSPGDVAW